MTAGLNDPRSGLNYSGISLTPQNILYSQIHNAEDIANDGHRNGVYEGVSHAGIESFYSSAKETLYHLTVLDVVQPLSNWDQRVNNAMTAIQANQSGATMGYNQSSGMVYTVGNPLIYPNKFNNNLFDKVYKKP